MAAITRLGGSGYGERLLGDFSGKATAAPSPHPVGLIARLGMGGYGERLAGTFEGKTAADGGTKMKYRPYWRPRRRP